MRNSARLKQTSYKCDLSYDVTSHFVRVGCATTTEEQTGRRGRAFHRGATVAWVTQEMAYAVSFDPFLFISLINAAPYLPHDTPWVNIHFINRKNVQQWNISSHCNKYYFISLLQRISCISLGRWNLLQNIAMFHQAQREDIILVRFYILCCSE